MKQWRNHLKKTQTILKKKRKKKRKTKANTVVIVISLKIKKVKKKYALNNKTKHHIYILIM